MEQIGDEQGMTSVPQKEWEALHRRIAELEAAQARQQQMAEALRDSEAKYRTLFEATTEAVFLENMEGHILDCNAAACQMFGYSKEELCGLTVIDLLPDEMAARLPHIISDALLTGGFFVEALNKRKNGQVFPVEVSARLVTLGGEQKAIVCIRDVTSYKQAEKVQAAIYRISEAAHAAQDLEALFRAIHAIIGELMPAHNFYIALYDATTERLSFPYFVDEFEVPPEPQEIGRGLSDYVLRTGEPLFASPEIFEQLVAAGQVELVGAPSIDWLGVPLKAEGKTIGVLAVQSYSPDVRFREQDLEVLSFVSDQVAMAIERKQAEAAIHRRDAILEAVSFIAEWFLRAPSWEQGIQEMLERLGQATQASRVYIFEKQVARDGTLLVSQRYEWAAPGIEPQIDNPQLQNFPVREMGFERWKAVLERGQPIYGHVRNLPAGERQLLAAQGICSIAVMPIFVGQELWGFIGFDECRAEREWSVVELDALRSVASTLGAAIQRRQAEEELRQIKEFNESIVQNIAEGIAVQDADFNFTFINPAAATMLGYTPDELIGRHWTLIVPPDQQPIIQAADQRRTRGASDRYQVDLLCKDGSRLPVLVSGSPRFDPETGRFVGTLAVLTDISEQVQAEERLRRYARQMGALYDTSLEIISQPDLPALLRAIVRRAAELVGVQMGGLYLVRPGDQELELVVSHNLPRDYTGTRLRPGEGASGRILQTGEPIIIPDYQTWEGRAAVYADSPFRRVLGVPLKVKGRVIGTINITDDKEPGEFSPDEVQLVSMFADQAAIAIENARLLEAEARRRREAETLWAATQALTSTLDLQQVFELILHELRQVVPHDSATVQQIKGDRLEIIGGSGFPNLEELLGVSFDLTTDDTPNRQVIRTRAPVILNDAPAVYEGFKRPPHDQAGIRSWLGVPLLFGDRLIGMIALNKQEPNFFTEEHARVALAFAAQAAIAIENARLFEEAQRRAEYMATLNRIGLAITSGLDLGEVLNALYEQLSRIMDVDAFYVALYDEETGIIDFPLLTGPNGPTHIKPQHVEHRPGLTGHVIRSRQPLYLPDIWAIPPEAPYQVIKLIDLPTRSYIGVPLIYRERVIGVLSVQSYEPNAYTDTDVQLVTTIATQAAVAIENARLFQAEREQREMAEALWEAARVMGASLELNQTLRLILDQLKRVLVYDTASVLILHEGNAPDLVVGVGFADEQMTCQEARGLLQESPILRQMARDLQPVISADVRQLEGWIWVPGAEHVRSWLGIPLVAHGTMIGALMVDHSQPGFYGMAELQRAQAIAQHAAQAIENARLFQAEREQREMAEALRQAAAAISSTLDRDEILDHILEQAGRVIPNDAVNVTMIEEGQVRIVRWRGYERFGQDIQSVLLPLDSTPSLQKMYQTGRPLVIPDTETYAGWVQVPEVDWVRSYAAAPIRVRDRVIGFLNADSATPNFYQQEHADRLRAFADQISLALTNAELFRMVAQDRRDWEVTFDAMQDAVAVVDHNQRIVRANRTFARLVHRSFPQIIGQNYPRLLKGMSCLQPPCSLERAGEGGQVATCTHEYQGRTFEVQVTPVAGEEKGEPHRAARAIYVLRDITERLRAEESQRRLSTAIEQAAEAVMITDPKGVIVYVNPAFERIVGYSRAEVVGQRPDVLATGSPSRISHSPLWAAVTAGQVWQERLRHVRRDGSPYILDITITPVRNQAGEIVNYVATMRDVTREIQLEEQFHQAQKMEALGQLAGGVAHDFNNLLTVIHLSTRLLRRQLRPEDPLWEHVVRIEEAGERAAKLTRQLLSFSRREVVEPRVLNLNQIVGDLSRMLQRIIGENIELKTVLADGLLPIKADPSQIDQVILNLAVNARDAMPHGGTLTIETSNIFLDQFYVASHVDARPGQHVLLSISDTGVGMNDEVKAHLFEPFFTTKERGQGTGLGLATVFGIVKQNGGHIRVYSEVGQGTTFKIYLPCTQDTGEQPPANVRPPATDSLVRGTETVLVVEDKHEVRDLIVQVLSSCGYQVLTAANGPEALQIGDQHAGPIHLLLTDVVMPRMNGKELADQFRERRPQLRVLYMSGYADNAIVEHGALMPGAAFLSKPFTVEDLMQKVRAVLDGRL